MNKSLKLFALNNIKSFFIFSLLALLFSCQNTAKDKAAETITFDLNAQYPKKEPSYSNVFNTEFIKIENDSIKLNFINIPYVDKDKIIGFSAQKIYIIDKNGKILDCINKRGNSGEEYLAIRDAFYDVITKEIFVLDMVKKKILIYDTKGNFLRHITLDNKIARTTQIRDYNKEAFISYNNTYGISEEKTGQFTIISKKDGRIIKDMRFTLKEKRTPYVFFPEGVYTSSETNFTYGKDYIIINEASCDTIYKLYPKNDKLEPFIIKTPKIHTLNKSNTSYLYPIWESSDYITLSKLTVDKSNPESPVYKRYYYFYDKKEKKFYEEISTHENHKRYLNFFTVFNIYSYNYFAETKPAYYLDKDRTFGKLREIVETLNEDDNPIITILSLK